MKVTIDTEDIAGIIYNKFIGDCECRTACYKYCHNSCIDAIHKSLIDEIEKLKNNTLQKSKNVII